MGVSHAFFRLSVCGMCAGVYSWLQNGFLRLYFSQFLLDLFLGRAELFPVLIPKSPRLYSRFPSFLSEAENEAWH